MKVLVTGGAGYIGSTTCWALKESGHTPIVLDNLSVGMRKFAESHVFYEGDISDATLIKKIFSEHPDISCTIHCAALIVVPDSVSNPFDYYTENVSKSILLFQSLKDAGCKNIVFSSSATVYDAVVGNQVTEETPLRPVNPYARSKQMMEYVLEDFCRAYGINGIALRYFNPIGAEPKMRCGPYLKNPTHLLNTLVNVALGKKSEFLITGTDFETRDGTGLRDYLHVWDLARAHVLAVEKIQSIGKSNAFTTINLGTGNGVTVREFVKAFEKVWGADIKKKEAPRREGDTAAYYAKADKAFQVLNWRAELTIENAITDALKWAKSV